MDIGSFCEHQCGRTTFNTNMYMSTSKFKLKCTPIRCTRGTGLHARSQQKEANMLNFYMSGFKNTSVRQYVHFCLAGPTIPSSYFPIKKVLSLPHRQPLPTCLRRLRRILIVSRHQRIFLPLQHLKANGLRHHSCVGIQRVDIQGQHLGVLGIGGDLHRLCSWNRM